MVKDCRSDRYFFSIFNCSRESGSHSDFSIRTQSCLGSSRIENHLIPHKRIGLINFGIKKTHKILDRSEFVRLSKCGKKFQDHSFIVIFLPGESDCSRLGITVSKRVGNAVVRNRIKRLIREWYRLNRFCLQGNWDLNVIAKKPAAGLTAHQVFAALEKLFAKLGGGRH